MFYPNLFLIVILSFGSLIFSANIGADIYKWADEDGRIHYSDRPSKTHESNKLNIKINSYESVSVESLSTKPGVVGSKVNSKQVVMYSTEWCGYCKKARNYFKQKGIPFVEYDIEKNARAKRQYDAMGARGVPVILVGKRRMNGFSPERFDEIYL
jgi:glutaredoxin-like YruB-family protein